VFYFSLLCRHIQDRCLLVSLFRRSFLSSFPYLFFFSCPSVSCLMSTLLNEKHTHKQHAVPRYKQNPGFLEGFSISHLLFSSFFFLLSSHLRVTRKSRMRERRMWSLLDFVCACETAIIPTVSFLFISYHLTISTTSVFHRIQSVIKEKKTFEQSRFIARIYILELELNVYNWLSFSTILRVFIVRLLSAARQKKRRTGGGEKDDLQQ
jgi:hypothetical protein